MRISAQTHRDRPWRIHDLARGFSLEDVWALPAEGEREEFAAVIALVTESNPGAADSLPARVLWNTRDRLGAWLGLGRIAAPAGPEEADDSLRAALPADLRGTADAHQFRHLPFQSLYATEDEFAAEMSNATVHGLMHLGWADAGGGRHRLEMAVYVKPRGAFGRAYMALIRPFRHLIVYPGLERQLGRQWAARRGHTPSRTPPSRRG